LGTPLGLAVLFVVFVVTLGGALNFGDTHFAFVFAFCRSVDFFLVVASDFDLVRED
jgi:hypothetical protein